MTFHTPVLVREVIEILQPRAGGVYVDATVGGGGHARAILEASAPSGGVLGIDRDPRAVAEARGALAEFGSRVEVRHARFGEISSVVEQGRAVDGIVADLGVSSAQIGDDARGFSWQSEGPLDLRMDPTSGEPAAAFVAQASADEIANVLYRYGDERRSRAIARELKRGPPVQTTADLVAAVARVMPGRRAGRVHPATRALQALRILVNDELGELERLLAAAPHVLAPGGRLAVIAFHSIEDRIVKHTLRGDARWRVLTKKPIEPSREEIAENPRSRSAKLRGAERVA